MNNRVAGIILAAGESKRLGTPKQLLQLHGKVLINYAINLAIESKLDPIVVVLGAYFKDIKSQLNQNQKIIIINNHSWQEGQSTSLVRGVDKVKNLQIPVLILLCDQPNLTPDLVDGIIDTQKTSKAEVVMLKTNGKRTPPVLFTPVCFPKIFSLTGDRGAREIVDDFLIEYFQNDDENKIQDIDTYEDYNKLNSN